MRIRITHYAAILATSSVLAFAAAAQGEDKKTGDKVEHSHDHNHDQEDDKIAKGYFEEGLSKLSCSESMLRYSYGSEKQLSVSGENFGAKIP